MQLHRKFIWGAISALSIAAPSFGAGVQSPVGELLRASNGTFYGVSSEGGSSSAGTIYSVTPDSEVTLLISLTGDTGTAKGSQPRAGLVKQGSLLWGTTSRGGTSGMGTLFKFDPNTKAFTTVVEFTGTNGSSPEAALASDGAGNLWGTTATGGANGFGTLFKVEASNGALTTVVDFTQTNGSEPKAAPYLDATGVLWGTTSKGGTLGLGTIFKYDTNTSTFTSVLSFSGTSGTEKGAAPLAALIQKGTDLWGTTDGGGTGGQGTVFGLSMGTGALTTVTNFNGTNGANPRGRLHDDGLGFFYGTTSAGGTSAQGTIFKLNSSTGALTTVSHFSGTAGGSKGSFPMGGLVADNSGALWGTATHGGREDLGAIYQVLSASGLFLLVAEPNPSASPPTATVAKPPGSSTSGAAGAAITLTGTAKDNVELQTVLVSINGGPFVRATITPPSAPGKPSTWDISVIPENGVNVVLIKSVDSGGDSSKLVKLVFNYTVVRPEVAGNYNGIAIPDAASATPFLHSGALKLKVLPTGRFTGKLTLSGTKAVALKGAFGNNGEARFGATGALSLVIPRKNLAPLVFTLNQDVTAPYTQQLTGTLQENGATVASVTAGHAIYTAKKKLVAPMENVPSSLLNPATDKGAYTGYFSTTGLGDGYAFLKVLPSGLVKVTGKLADGLPFTSTVALSADDSLPFYARTAGGKGALLGIISFRDTPAQSDADGIGLLWFKPAVPKAKAFRAGWPAGIATDFYGSKYVAPKVSGKTPLGQDTGTGNGAITMEDGGLAGPRGVELSISTNGSITPGIGVPVGASAVSGLSVKLSTSGLLSGKFVHPPSTKSVSFIGAAFQKTHSASGSFLAPPAVGAPTTDEWTSGRVDISTR